MLVAESIEATVADKQLELVDRLRVLQSLLPLLFLGRTLGVECLPVVVSDSLNQPTGGILNGLLHGIILNAAAQHERLHRNAINMLGVFLLVISLRIEAAEAGRQHLQLLGVTFLQSRDEVLLAVDQSPKGGLVVDQRDVAVLELCAVLAKVVKGE